MKNLNMKKICLEIHLLMKMEILIRKRRRKKIKFLINNYSIFNKYDDNNNINIETKKENKDDNNNYSIFDRPIQEISLEINNKKFGKSKNVDYSKKVGLSNKKN